MKLTQEEIDRLEELQEALKENVEEISRLVHKVRTQKEYDSAGFMINDFLDRTHRQILMCLEQTNVVVPGRPPTVEEIVEEILYLTEEEEE